MTSIGITGIIGSGKSMLSQVFRSMDIPVYDADSRAKSLMNSNLQIKESLVSCFGENTYTNGTINKDYLRKIVFGSEENRKTINSIVHPAVKQDFIDWRNAQNSNITAIESAITAVETQCSKGNTGIKNEDLYNILATNVLPNMGYTATATRDANQKITAVTITKSNGSNNPADIFAEVSEISSKYIRCFLS